MLAHLLYSYTTCLLNHNNMVPTTTVNYDGVAVVKAADILRLKTI